jgi:glycosyltransferase involved in cell wall biosynthesis
MIRLGVVCDLVEENFPSMDLVAERLLHHLHTEHAAVVAPAQLRPPMKQRLPRLPVLDRRDLAFNTDRLLNRFHDYPKWLKRRTQQFDIFHVVDHSYAQLVHELPAERTIVTCHDLDTFRCLLEPQCEPRSSLFRVMTKKILRGLRKAALVTCDSKATREALLAYEIIPPDRAIVVHNGVHPTFSLAPDGPSDAALTSLIGLANRDDIDLLHVGSTIPRKRVDVLLRVMANVNKEFPRARLLRAGGQFTRDQIRLVEQLDLADSIVVLPRLEIRALAALYRRATLVLQPSEREGFGLPVVEAMACGVPVVASNINVLREVGGEATSYCHVADIDSWTQTVCRLLRERQEQPEQWTTRQAKAVAQAARFSWSEYGHRMVALYQRLC